MGKIALQGNNIGCNYDFVVDPASGAIGTVALDGILFVSGIIRRCTIVATTAFTSGGAALISFGLRQIGVAAPVAFNTALAPAQSFAYYNALDQLGNFIARPGNDFNANPLKMYTGYEVIMVISGAALTAGAINVNIEYGQNTF